MVAKRRPAVFLPEATTSLQFGHDEIDELLITPRHVGSHDIETVAVSRVQEFFHKVGNAGWVTYGYRCAETDAVEVCRFAQRDRRAIVGCQDRL